MKKRNYVIYSLCMLLMLAGCTSRQDVNKSEQKNDLESSQKKEVVIKNDNPPDQPVKEKEEAPSITNDNTVPDEDDSEVVDVIMVGDILLHMPVEDAARDEDGKYDFDFVFANLKEEISNADIAIANQEVIIGGEELGISGYPSFNAPVEIADSLVEAGFDVICHATNHALDKGKRGILNTCEYWDSEYPEITVLGINKDENEYKNVNIIEKNGIKIALLNYTYGTNGIQQPSDMPYAVDMLDEEKVAKDLEYAEENADFTIVCPHWGTEYNLEIDAYQEKWSEFFREKGADLVIGAHPHVIEPVMFMEDGIEGNTNNHGNGDMLIYYSLGNFVNWTSGKGSGVANRMLGGMAKVTIEKKEGEAIIKDYGIRALVCHVESGHERVTVYPLNEYTDELASRNEIVHQDPDFSKEYLKKLCQDVWYNNWE
ncbi:CapA family protein [Butyrivibrio sp. LC3010]|uniref:CapA family protein n=1 Tax=Butyrivibrio sp. LC3010 TaxID=1280680 RepID=UPI00047DA684|nr:CapA family protein [Butyrivibrio sp. LC3010]